MRICVYVPLLDEGAFRPAPAELLSPLVARLLVPTDYDAGREQWRFAPGTTVRLAKRLMEGEEVYVAVGQAGRFGRDLTP